MNAPWLRQQGEPEAAYARFLIYRNLGPARSVRAAYLEHAGAAEGRERQIPGSWQRECARWSWVSRAESWDCHVFTTAGEQAVVALVHAFRDLGRACVRRMAGRAPKTWDELLRSLEFLARVIPKESIAGLHARLAAAGPGQGGPAEAAPGPAAGEGA
jgi:hypothetical protein